MAETVIVKCPKCSSTNCFPTHTTPALMCIPCGHEFDSDPPEKWKARARELARSIQGATGMVCDDPDCALCAIAVEQSAAALSAAYAEGVREEREACVLVATKPSPHTQNFSQYQVGLRIAEAIRARRTSHD